VGPSTTPLLEENRSMGRLRSVQKGRVIACILSCSVFLLGCSSPKPTALETAPEQGQQMVTASSVSVAITTTGTTIDLAAGAIPWIDEPAPTPVPWTRTATPGIRPCDVASLEIGAPEGPGAAAGSVIWHVPLTNHSPVACSLPLTPTRAEGLDASRHRVALEIGTYIDNIPPPELDAGETGNLRLSAQNVCYPDEQRVRDTAYESISFYTPMGVMAVPSLKLILCRPVVAALFVRDESKPRKGSAASLQARIQLIEPGRAGSPMRYVVELTNPTDIDVVLSPCPGYIQVVSDPRKSQWSKRDLALNCTAVNTIRAAASIRFLMSADVPAAITGPAFLVWSLDRGPSTTVNLTIA